MNIPILIIQGNHDTHQYHFNLQLQNGVNSNVLIQGNVDNISVQEFKELVLPEVQQVVGELPITTRHLQLHWQGIIPYLLHSDENLINMINTPEIPVRLRPRLSNTSRIDDTTFYYQGITYPDRNNQRLRWALYRCTQQQPILIYVDIDTATLERRIEQEEIRRQTNRDIRNYRRVIGHGNRDPRSNLGHVLSFGENRLNIGQFIQPKQKKKVEAHLIQL